MARNSEEQPASIARRLWRDARNTRVEDAELQTQFRQRAAEVRDQVQFLLAGGLSAGAEQSLSALAEQDMLDFDILVDLAASIDIDGVAPLPARTRQHLAEFLATDPWASLAVDHDLTVALAMIGNLSMYSRNRPRAENDNAKGHENAADLYRILAELLDSVNTEQCGRFIAELELLAGRPEFALDADTAAHIDQLVLAGARRVGTKPPQRTLSGSKSD